MRRICALVICGLISSGSFAASDEGVITQLYTDSSGSLAVKLDGGFPNSVAANECSTASGNGWAGVAPAINSALKAALLAAKTSQSPVSLSITGCEAGGAWLRITAVYVK